MRRSLDYYFAVSSPWAYLGLDRFRALVTEHDLDVRPFPMTIIAENGAIASKDRPAARRAYWQKDMLRWARYLGKTILLDNRPTSDWVPASFMIVAAELDGLDWMRLVGVVQERWWGHADDIGDPQVRRRIADTAGFDGGALLAREQSCDVQAKWHANRDQAREEGVFGSPTYVFEGEHYWGQDSLPFLKMHLAGELVPASGAKEAA